MATIEATNHAVFVETNLNTRFAVTITNTDTVQTLKEKISTEHLNCFRELGKINVSDIKVKRKKHFFHLSDSMLVKIVFERVERTWYLYVDATLESIKVEKSEDQIAHDPIGESMKVEKSEDQTAHDPIGESMKVEKSEDQLHSKQAVAPGLAVKRVKKKKKNPASLQQAKATAAP